MSAPPSNANDECVGPESEKAGTASSCDGCPNQDVCKSGEPKKVNPALAKVERTMAKIKHTVLVLSGKGGVGKSTTSAQLAFGLARQGLKVGLLDVDICGPSIPMMLGLRGQEVHQSASGWSPVYVDVEPNADAVRKEDEPELGVMSIGFLTPDPDAAVIWRGPRKNGLIEQFFTQVDWGDLDYLIIDTPPGSSDEHISIVQLLKNVLDPAKDGAIVVTTPQEASMADVRKELNFCAQTKLRVIGVVENMSGLSIPVEKATFFDRKTGKDETAEALAAIRAKCPELLRYDVFAQVFPQPETGGPEQMSAKFDVPFLGRIPLDPSLQRACEQGEPAAALRGNASGSITRLVEELLSRTQSEEEKIQNAKIENHEPSGSGVVTA